MLALFSLPANLGYLALALVVGAESMGVPSPGETGLVAAAVLANKGQLDIVLVILIASAAAIVGDNVGYLIGRHGGRKLLERPGPFHQRRLAVIAYGDRFFDRHGPKAVFFGRWIALARVTSAWMAGANGMPARTFFFWNALGGVTWATTVGLVGYALGEAGGHVLGTVGVVGAVVLVGTVLGGLAFLKVRERRHLAADGPAATGTGTELRAKPPV